MDDLNLQSILSIDDSIQIATNEMRLSTYNKNRSHLISPQGICWNFSILSVFLNETTAAESKHL